MAAAQADASKCAELLKALASADNAARQRAEALYQQAKQSEPESLLVGMLVVLGSAEVEEAVRRHGAVLLRQMVVRGPEKDFLFARLLPQRKQEVAAELLRCFEQEPLPKLQRKVGEVVAKLAEYVCDKEDPRCSLAPGTCGWPALLPQVLRMADASTTASPEACEAALRLLRDLVPTLKDEVVGARQQLGQILQAGLMHASLKLRTAALLLVCEIVGETERKAWAPLLVTASVIVQVLQQLAAAGEEELLQEALQALIEVASEEPEFFKAQLSQSMEPAKFMASLARSQEGVANGPRSLALEWLVSYLEKRSKWLTKHLPDYAPLALQACMDLMVDMEDGEEELKVWAARMDDEEGDEDDNELFNAGADAIDRVVRAMQIEVIGSALSNLIAHFAAQEAWQAKHAALAAVKQTGEYIEEKAHADAMASLLLQHLEHPHPRVRYMALLGVVQLAKDQAPHLQESKHQVVMPLLLKTMDDSVDRVAAMAMTAFYSFAEELDNSLMLQYAQTFMEKLCAKLQATQHRGVREESITAIAVIAEVLGKDFSRYYDSIMPMLKQFVMHALGAKENRLRGKSFECMSLLGIAVGKEKFLPDAGEAIAEMMKTPLEADDVQREYIKEASERICQCLQKDFAPFLPNLLVGILKSLKLEDASDGAAPQGGPGADAEDGDAYIQVTTGEGKLVKVRTQRFEEMMQSAQLLHTFLTELKGAYFDWVPATAEALLPLLSAADDSSYLCDEIRGLATRTWALLVKAALLGAQERGQPAALAGELLRTGLQRSFVLLEKGQDAEMLTETANGVKESIKNVGPGVLAAEEVSQLVGRSFALLDQSFERSRCAEKLRQDHKAASAVPGLQQPGEGEEDEDDEPAAGDERTLRQAYEEVLGALMQVAPAEFLWCLPDCAERLRSWIASRGNRVLALQLGCDLVAHLQGQSEPVWPILMPEVFRALGDADADARTAAAYAVSLAAPLPRFAEAAPEAFGRLAQLVGGKKPGRGQRHHQARLALDNAVAALLTLALAKAALCPPEVQVWPLIIARLPLKEDEEEAKKVHDKLVDLVLEDHQGLLGGPGRPSLGQVLGILAEVYHAEVICRKETEAKILKVFKQIPVDVLKGFAAGFSEKQQRKIELMLTSA